MDMISAFIKKPENKQYFIDFVTRMCKINSGTTTNFEGIRRVGDLVADELKDLGFTAEWEVMPPKIARAGNLFISNNNKNAKTKILLITHLDTVYQKDSDFNYVKHDISADRIIGPGVVDMKGGIAIAILALRALHVTGELNNLSITIAAMGDEESTGDPVDIARAGLIEHAKNCDYGFGLEFNSSLTDIVTVRRGTQKWNLYCRAAPGHSARVFVDESSSGAVYLLAELLTKLRQELSKISSLTFNPALIAGGQQANYDWNTQSGQITGKANIVAGESVSCGDLRFKSKADLDLAENIINQTIKSFKNRGTIDFTWHGGYHPPLEETPLNLQLLQFVNTVHKDLNWNPAVACTPDSRGAADANYIATYLPIIDGLGAIGGKAHVEHEEYIDVTSTLQASERLALILSKFCA